MIESLKSKLGRIPTYTPREQKCIQKLDLNENLAVPRKLLKDIIV
jgi:hypothetical protein